MALATNCSFGNHLRRLRHTLADKKETYNSYICTSCESYIRRSIYGCTLLAHWVA